VKIGSSEFTELSPEKIEKALLWNLNTWKHILEMKIMSKKSLPLSPIINTLRRSSL